MLEETGVHISIFSDFCFESRYKIGSRIEKRVDVFLAVTEDTQTVIQKEEIEDYIWLRYPEALSTLRFDNDKEILTAASDYMLEHNI